MKVGIISFTARGAQICRQLWERFGEEGVECHGYVPPRFMKPEWQREGIRFRDQSLSQWTEDMFRQKRAMVFIGAAGIAVRAVAPFVCDKMTDPPVVAVDEGGQFCIPLLSGHVGGANELAVKMAAWLKGTAVITTATDVNGVFAVDVFASRNRLTIRDREEAKRISACLLEGETVGFFLDRELRDAAYLAADGMVSAAHGGAPVADGALSASDGMLPASWVPKGCLESVCSHNIRITCRNETWEGIMDGQRGVRPVSGPSCLRLVPKSVVVGLGCRKGTLPHVLENRVLAVLEENGFDLAAVKAAATIDIKGDEPAVTELAEKYGWELRTYTAEELNRIQGEFTESEFVKKTVGVGNVCERACAAKGGRLLLHKQTRDGITVAAALEGFKIIH